MRASGEREAWLPPASPEQATQSGARGRAGEGREREKQPLLEHGLLLLLFLLLAIHDGLDDLPLFLCEVAEVGHLELRWRRLRWRGAAPGPGRGRHFRRLELQQQRAILENTGLLTQAVAAAAATPGAG